MILRSKYLISLLLLSSLFGAKYLAVIDLEPVGLSDTEAKVLTQRLTSKMIELGSYTVVERANIDKILKEQKFQHSGCTDSECAVEIGQLLNADVSVIGTASKFGKTYTLDCRIINVESGEAIESASYTHTGEIDELVKDGIESIAHKLLGIPYKKKISSGTTSKASSGYGATLEINSDPTGAEVYIGGNFFDTTPLILEDFPAGDYEVELRLEGYEDYTKSVKLLPRGYQSVNATLEIIPSYIIFKGTPKPKDIKIWIDEKEYTLNNPFSNNPSIKVISGEHIVRISSEGYFDKSYTVTLSEGVQMTLEYKLEKNIGFSQLNINPRGAKIYIDGYKKSYYAELVPGMHTLKVSKPGYDDYTGEFEIKLGETTELDIELNRQYGYLDLTIEPYNATVYFNDSLALSFNVPMDLNNNTFEFKLETGTYNVRAEKPSFYTKSMMATINNKERTQLTLALKSGLEEYNKLQKQNKKHVKLAIIPAVMSIATYAVKTYYNSKYEDATSELVKSHYLGIHDTFNTAFTVSSSITLGAGLYITYNKQRAKTLKFQLSL